MTITAKVLVEGDPGALEVIAAALLSAGLSGVEVGGTEVGGTPPRQDVTPFPVPPGSWAALVDVAPGLAHADWRNEVFNLTETADSGSLRMVSARPESGVAALRPAV